MSEYVVTKGRLSIGRTQHEAGSTVTLDGKAADRLEAAGLIARPDTDAAKAAKAGGAWHADMAGDNDARPLDVDYPTGLPDGGRDPEPATAQTATVPAGQSVPGQTQRRKG